MEGRTETGTLDTPLRFGHKIIRPSTWVPPVLTTLKNVTSDHATAGAPSSGPAAKRVSATSRERGSYEHVASSLAAGSCGPATPSGQHVAGARIVDRHGRGEVPNVPPSEALYIMIRRAADEARRVYREDGAEPLARQGKGPGPRHRPGEQHSSPACRREARRERHLPRGHNPAHLLAARNALTWSAQRPGAGRTVAPGGECRRSAGNTASRCAMPNLVPGAEHRCSDMEPPCCVSLHRGRIDATHSSHPTEGSTFGRARRDLFDACSSEGPRLRPSAQCPAASQACCSNRTPSKLQGGSQGSLEALLLAAPGVPFFVTASPLAEPPSQRRRECSKLYENSVLRSRASLFISSRGDFAMTPMSHPKPSAREPPHARVSPRILVEVRGKGRLHEN